MFLLTASDSLTLARTLYFVRIMLYNWLVARLLQLRGVGAPHPEAREGHVTTASAVVVAVVDTLTVVVVVVVVDAPAIAATIHRISQAQHRRPGQKDQIIWQRTRGVDLISP